MFVYLNTRGRYVLTLVFLWMTVLFAIGSLTPVGMGVAMAQNQQQKSPKRPSKPKRPATVNATDQRPNAKAAPSASELSEKMFTPWVESDVPWDAGWGAFNDKVSERTGGSCGVSGGDAKALRELKTTLESDWSKINGSDERKGEKVSLWRKNYQSRVTTGKPLDHDVLKDQKQMKNVRRWPASIIGPAGDSYGEWISRVNSDPLLASCDGEGLGAFQRFMDRAMPNIFMLFKEPGAFIAQVIMLPFTIIFGPIYAVLAPIAPGLALNTPHSERGDHLLNSFSISAAAAVHSDSDGQMKRKQCSSSNDAKAQAVDAELGFACQNLDADNQESNIWIKISKSLRSLLSAVYGIVVITASLVYLFRRNANSQYNIKVIMPRLMAAVLLSMIIPWAMGAGITFSNWLVQGLLNERPGSIPNQIDQGIFSISEIDWGGLGLGGLVGGLIGGILSMFLMVLYAIVFLGMLIVALAKQFALIALIILFPLACLTFVFSGNQGFFNTWLKGYAAVIGLPVAMAAILTVGLELSQAFYDSADTNGLSAGGRMVAAMSMAVCGVMMLKCVKIFRGWATGNSASLFKRAAAPAVQLGGAAAGAAIATGGGNPMLAARVIKGSQAAAGAIGRERGSSWKPSTSGMGGAASRSLNRLNRTTLAKYDGDKLLKEAEEADRRGAILNRDQQNALAQRDKRLKAQQGAEAKADKTPPTGKPGALAPGGLPDGAARPAGVAPSAAPAAASPGVSADPGHAPVGKALKDGAKELWRQGVTDPAKHTIDPVKQWAKAHPKAAAAAIPGVAAAKAARGASVGNAVRAAGGVGAAGGAVIGSLKGTRAASAQVGRQRARSAAASAAVNVASGAVSVGNRAATVSTTASGAAGRARQAARNVGGRTSGGVRSAAQRATGWSNRND